MINLTVAQLRKIIKQSALEAIKSYEYHKNDLLLENTIFVVNTAKVPKAVYWGPIIAKKFKLTYKGLRLGCGKTIRYISLTGTRKNIREARAYFAKRYNLAKENENQH